MFLTKEVFVTSEEIIEMGISVYIFGAGLDGEKLFHKLSNKITVKGYVDNNRYGHELCGKKIIKLSEYMELNDNSILVIASYRYAREISNNLKQLGLEEQKDFLIWDDDFIFHTNEDIIDYVTFNKKRFGSKKTNKSNSVVLIPFHNRIDLFPTSLGYCAEYFTSKTGSRIIGYFRNGVSKENASEVMIDVYNSIGMEELIDTKLSVKDEKKAEDIFLSLWETLSTWEDLKNIRINGIQLGTAIIRFYLRYYIPEYEVKCQELHKCLRKVVNDVVFWNSYFDQNEVEVLLIGDAVCWDGILLNLALSKGIKVYAVDHVGVFRPEENYYFGRPYKYFKAFFEQLTQEEKKYGISWAKERLKERIGGNSQDAWLSVKQNFPFAQKIKDRIVSNSEKKKIMICPHTFEEDEGQCGMQLFDDSYISWLYHLGELSERLIQYEWYIKIHPAATRRDNMIIDSFLMHFPNIIRIPPDISPIQLKNEGVDVALTVYGSIGHEYPLIGIQVINAGDNPHSSFDFTWSPKSKEEFDELLYGLGNLKPKENLQELYEFYCINYLFYDWNYCSYKSLFWKDERLGYPYDELQCIGLEAGTWMYRKDIEEWSEERDKEIREKVANAFTKIDNWRADIFYKKEVAICHNEEL